MNFSVSDIYFTKNDIAIFEDLFVRLAEPNSITGPFEGRINRLSVNALLSHLRLAPESQSLIVAYMKSAGHFERKDFFIFLRLASILHSQHSVSKDLVCQFDTPRAFLDLITETVDQIVADRDKLGVILPPPPAKGKLKRVHTIAGDTTNCTSLLSASMNPSSISATGALNSSSVSSHSGKDALANSGSQPQLVDTGNGLTQFSHSSSLSNENDLEEDNFWRITAEQKEYYTQQFTALQSDFHGTVRGHVAKVFFEKSKMPVEELSTIWKLADVDKDGALSLPEFCIAMHLVVLRRNSVEIPISIPDSLLEIYSSFAKEGHYFSLADLTDPGRSNSDDNDGSSASNSATKQWTLFSESPLFSSASNSRTSPDQLPVNFDYNFAESIATNPTIKHPVPLRFSPAASPSVAFSRLSNEIPMTPGRRDSDVMDSTNGQSAFLSGSSFPLPSTAGEWHIVSSEAASAAHSTENTTNSPLSMNGKSKCDKQAGYLIPNDGTLRDLKFLGLEERLIARYMPPLEVNIPSDFSSKEELQKSLRALQDYSNTVTEQNQHMLVEILSLCKLLRKAEANLLPF